MIKSVIWLKIENSLSRNSSYNLYQNTKDTEMSLSLNFDVRYDDVFVTKLNHADWMLKIYQTYAYKNDQRLQRALQQNKIKNKYRFLLKVTENI